MPQKLDPSTSILGTRNSLGEFWQWAYSDVMNNRNRSILAEWLVGCALGAVEKVREEWDGCDLLYGSLKVEIKSAAYLQSWQQKVPSKITFDIAHKRAWISEQNERSAKPVRFADVYVFCLFKELNRDLANVLDVKQWEFYVMETRVLNERYGSLKSLSLNRLKQHCTATEYSGIRGSVDLCRVA